MTRGLILRFGIWFALTLAIFTPAKADDLRDTATAAQLADVGTTAIGLALGAAEANPLGLALLPIKYGAMRYADGIADPLERSEAHRALSATGWGPAVNNVCVIAVVLTGGTSAAWCLTVGIAAGMADWHRTQALRERAAFDTVCERETELNPDLVCTYTAPTDFSQLSPPGS